MVEMMYSPNLFSSNRSRKLTSVSGITIIEVLAVLVVLSIAVLALSPALEMLYQPKKADIFLEESSYADVMLSLRARPLQPEAGYPDKGVHHNNPGDLLFAPDGGYYGRSDEY